MEQCITRLHLLNVRSFSSLTLDFEPKANEIIGDNGRGKTSILESIYLLMTASSFRTSVLKELVKHGASGFIVEAYFTKEGHSFEIKFAFESGRRHIFYNGSPVPSQSAVSLLIGLINGVISSSQDSMLIKGPPALRRRFLDMQIAQADPLYVHHLTRYNRALKQRNCLIRDKKTATITAWEKELASSGAYIVIERRKTIASLSDSVDYFFKHFVDDFPGHIRLNELSTCLQYVDAETLCGHFEEQYEKRRHQEMLYGQTLVGPHRHDLEISSLNHPCRDFASEGEVRVLSLALRFAEWKQLYDRTQIKPIFLSDDIRAHLDEKRLSMVQRALDTIGQVIVTGQERLSTQAQSVRHI